MEKVEEIEKLEETSENLNEIIKTNDENKQLENEEKVEVEQNEIEQNEIEENKVTEIEEIEEKHKANPHLREAHKTLAREVITDLHGKEEFEKAVKISEALFSGNIKSLAKEEILIGFKDVSSFDVKSGTKLIDMLIENNICQSKREAREFLNAGSISINDEKVSDEEMIIDDTLAIDGEILVIKRGKKKNFIGIIK